MTPKVLVNKVISTNTIQVLDKDSRDVITVFDNHLIVDTYARFEESVNVLNEHSERYENKYNEVRIDQTDFVLKKEVTTIKRHWVTSDENLDSIDIPFYQVCIFLRHDPPIAFSIQNRDKAVSLFKELTEWKLKK